MLQTKQKQEAVKLSKENKKDAKKEEKDLMVNNFLDSRTKLREDRPQKEI
jgi:hypothetical protein